MENGCDRFSSLASWFNQMSLEQIFILPHLVSHALLCSYMIYLCTPSIYMCIVCTHVSTLPILRIIMYCMRMQE